jgi:hypothetical protein
MFDGLKRLADDFLPDEVKNFHKRITLNDPLQMNSRVMVEHEITVNGVSHKRFEGLIVGVEERKSLPIKKYFYQIDPVNTEIQNKLTAPLWVKDSHVRKTADPADWYSI